MKRPHGSTLQRLARVRRALASAGPAVGLGAALALGWVIPAYADGGEGLFSLSVHARIGTLKYDVSPDLRVALNDQPGRNALVDTCQLQPNTTYRDVAVELTITNSSATLTCSTPAGNGSAEGGATAASAPTAERQDRQQYGDTVSNTPESTARSHE